MAPPGVLLAQVAHVLGLADAFGQDEDEVALADLIGRLEDFANEVIFFATGREVCPKRGEEPQRPQRPQKEERVWLLVRAARKCWPGVLPSETGRDAA